MSMIALAAVLLSGQSAAPPARSAEELTRDLNSTPPSAVAPVAPRPAPASESESASRPAPAAPAAPARPAPSRPSATPQAAPRSPAPSTATTPARPAPTGSTSSLTRDLNSGPPSANPTPRPSTPAPTAPAPRPAPIPAPAPSTDAAPAQAAPAPDASGSAETPASDSAEAAVEALPFRIDLPEGFEVEPSDAGPQAKVYAVRKDGRSFVMIYQGPASQFPIYDGELIDAGGRASVVVDEGGRRRAVEHLFAKDLESRETHVWVSYLEGPDAAQAEQIAQSVEPR